MGHWNRLTDKQKKKIIELYVKDGIPPEYLAKRFTSSANTVTKVLKEVGVYKPGKKKSMRGLWAY